MTILGNTLRLLRTEAGLSVAALAAAIDLSPATICNIESGYINPDMKTVQRISDYFHVTAGYLLGSVDVTLSQESTDEASSLYEMDRQRFVHMRVVPMSQADGSYAADTGSTQSVILPLPASDAGDYIAVSVLDDSMAAYRIQKGDTAVVSLDPFSVRNGDIVLTCGETPGSAYLCHYEREGATISLDGGAEKSRSLQIPVSDTMHRILGRVVQIIIDTH